MQLEPCPACKRHVRTDERVCPFCATEIVGAMTRAPKRALPGQRLGRAALMAFSVGAGAAALTGCDDDAGDNNVDVAQPVYGAPVQDGGRAGLDASTKDSGTPDASAPDASKPDASAPDASTHDAAAADASAQDAGKDSGHPGVMPLYGLSPVVVKD